MRTKNVGLTLVLIAGGSLLGSVGRAGESVTQQSEGKAHTEMSVPATPDEHLARAATYQQKAVAYREEAAAHRRMFADFDRRQGNPALQSKMGHELPWIAKMRKHCEGYIKEAERLASAADSFAEFHRMSAQAMGER